MAGTAIRALFCVIVGAAALSACGLDPEGLAVVANEDASAPEVSMDTGVADGADLAEGADGADVADGAGLADDSSANGSTEDADAPPGVKNPDTASFAAAAEASDAMGDANDESDAGNEAGTDATTDGYEAASDATGDVGSAPDTSGGDGAASDAASDANACVLPVGTTMCCGSVACANHGGSCSTPGICGTCQGTCTPAKPICCALGGQTVKCEVKAGDC